MDTTKKRKQNKLAFITTIFVIVGILFLGLTWLAWQDENEANRIADVVQSIDLADILHNQKNRDKLDQELNALWKAKNNAISNEHVNTVRDVFNTTQPKSSMSNIYLKGIPDYTDDAITLALRNISISQGKEGKESWRLQAEWATLRQSSAVMRVHKPYLQYQLTNSKKSTQKKSSKNNKLSSLANKGQYNKNNANTLIIHSQNGFVFDNNTKIRLIQKVQAKNQSNQINSDILDYNDTTNMAIFSESPIFSGEDVTGKALELSWDLNNNRITGKGGVEFTWSSAPTSEK